jgi:hypothetical protein
MEDRVGKVFVQEPESADSNSNEQQSFEKLE